MLHSHHTLLHTHLVKHMKTFLSSLSTAPNNILQKKTVIIYTTAYTHASYVTMHFYKQQYLRTRLGQFKYIFHQVASISFLLN